MPAAVVLLAGYTDAPRDGRQRAGGSVTLVKGPPHVLVDTGGPDQRDALLAALRAHGLEPSDVGVVVVTHGHLDHTGNLNLFPHATFVQDTDVCRDGEYWGHDFAAAPLTIEGTPAGTSIAVIATPGHTDHDLTVVVRTPEGTTAIVGNLFEREGDWLDETVWTQWSKDAARQRASRAVVLRLADHIVPGHGPLFAVPRSLRP